jgi:hypothetical protein
MIDVAIVGLIVVVAATGIAWYRTWSERERLRLRRAQFELDRERDEHIDELIADRRPRNGGR